MIEPCCGVGFGIGVGALCALAKTGSIAEQAARMGRTEWNLMCDSLRK
jgi:hypothetical protein